MGKKKNKTRKTDMSQIEQRLAELGSGTFFKPKEGKNIIRILPPWNDDGMFFFEQPYHYGLKKEGRTLTIAGPNPIVMKYLKKMSEMGSEDAKLAKRLEPRTKYYANILDRKSKKIMIWGFSKKILQTILSAMADPDYGDITDEEDGHDIVIERVGTGLETKYEVRVRPKPSEVGDDVNLDNLHILDEVVEDYSDSEIKAMLKETFDSVDDDDDDDEPKKKKKKDDDDEDDEDDDEDDDDDDDEEEEKPKKKKKKKEKEEKKKKKGKKETTKSKKKKRK